MTIHVNQVGYLPHSAKTGIATQPATTFHLCDQQTGKTVYTGTPHNRGYDPISGDQVYALDFSDFSKEGVFFLQTDRGDTSPPFSIGAHVYGSLEKDLLKALYLQRCGCALESAYAGEYQHAPCHTAPCVLLEDSSVSLDLPGGWHDAGDYGRYTTPAATTVAHLLYAYELFPTAFQETIHIPESGNGVPDVLNECRYELDWLLKMQEPQSGGVYHRITPYTHALFVMPEDDHKQLLVFPVSSVATGAFCGCLALASRIYAPFDAVFAAQLLAAARHAWQWLETHPDPVVPVGNPPGGNTGIYEDEVDLDERLWASAEMFRATTDILYHHSVETLWQQHAFDVGFGYANVSGFALLTVAFAPENMFHSTVKKSMTQRLIQQADVLLERFEKDGYGNCLQSNEYVWGSNMTVGNNGILFVLAKLLTGNAIYEKAALSQLDYLLGKNALGICYVTGEGTYPYQNPHHRPAYADGIDAAMPGWVAGGPNRNLDDEKSKWLIPEDTPPARCYLDLWECYSLNEITIYWNAPFIFLTAYTNSV